MQGRAGQQAAGTSGDAFDVRVVAFSGPRAQTLRGLQEIFGVDAATATQLLDSVPAIVRRGVSGQQAQSYVAALQRVGAQVVLERPVKPHGQGPRPPAPATAARRAPPPPAPRAPRGAPPPPPPQAALGPRDDGLPGAAAAAPDSELPLPKPILRPPSSDLEFDMLGGSDTLAGELPSALQANDVDPNELGGGATKTARSNARRQELELDAGGSVASLDLDPAATSPRIDATQHAVEPVVPETEDAAPAARTGGLRPLRNPEQADAQRGPPMSRAAVVQHGAISDDRPERSLALLQLLAAVAVGVGGAQLDNSIFYGNASLFSVIVHGLALQQLGYGVWRLLR